MHLPDQSQPTELNLKGGPDGKNYIGPGEEPAGGARDREIVAFDGRVLITRFIDPEVSGRYGSSIYVRRGNRAERKEGRRQEGERKGIECCCVHTLLNLAFAITHTAIRCRHAKAPTTASGLFFGGSGCVTRFKF